jgi:hypothetical protein
MLNAKYLSSGFSSFGATYLYNRSTNKLRDRGRGQFYLDPDLGKSNLYSAHRLIMFNSFNFLPFGFKETKQI